MIRIIIFGGQCDMGRRTRNGRNGWKRRNSSTWCDASCSSITNQPLKECKIPRTEDVLTAPSTNYAKLNSGEQCTKEDTRLSRADQEGSVYKRSYASVSRGHTDKSSTDEYSTGGNEAFKEESVADRGCDDNKSCQEFATVLRRGLNPVKESSCQSMKRLVTIYSIKSSTGSVSCLKCKADDMEMSQNKEPRLIFRHEELVVTAVTVDEDKSSNPPLCSVFDNYFVQSHERALVTFWKKYLEYVKNGQHIIDLHGMSRVVAEAAVESVVARESQYAKDIRGNADGSYKMLQIITGRGSHSSGAPVLPDAVINHLTKLGYTKIKQINPGLIEVDVRSSKSQLFRPFSIRSV